MFSLDKKTKEAIVKAKKKIKKNGWADEFVNLFRYNNFSISISASKDTKSEFTKRYHANPHDVFILVLSGQMNIIYKTKRISVLPKNAIIIPANKKHKAAFPKLTVCLVGAYSD